MRTLITGAGGFAGRHLAAVCAEQGIAFGLGRGEVNAAAIGLAEHFSADLLDAEATRAAVAQAQPDYVFHLAADASVAASWEDPAQVIRNNVLSTTNLLEAVHAQRPQARVLIAGSGEQYGTLPPESLPAREDEPQRPENPYALSKVLSERVGEFYGRARGLAVACTRSFNHAGPGQAPAYVVAAFASQIAAAEVAGKERVEVRTGNVEVRRDFTDVRDVARAYWLLLERGASGAFNVCSGVSVRVADILAGLARHSRLTIEQRTDEALVRAQDVMDIRGSNDRLVQATGWRPEIALDRTLADTLEWWRRELAP